MNKLNAKQLDAIVRLQNEDDFKVFMGWLKESKESEFEVLAATREDPDRAWMQGRVQQLGYILAAINKARATLSNVEANGRS